MEAQAIVEITPRMLAQAFWDMHDGEQAEFFEILQSIIEKDSDQFHFEMQSFALDKKLSGKGRDALMTLAAPQYLNVLRYAGK